MSDRTTISPSIHEACIRKYTLPGSDDPVLTGLIAAVQTTREHCEKARDITAKILSNPMATPPANHRKARDVGYELQQRALLELDNATKAALAEIAALRKRTAGPPGATDLVTETKQRELRERLSLLSEAKRREIIANAIRDDDDLLVGAVLGASAWLSGLLDSDRLMVQHTWQQKHHAGDVDRAARLEKAVADARRAGTLTIGFIAGLTNLEMIEEAAALEAKAKEALAAADV